MPIDAVFLESLRCELQQQLLACRVDKVQQPERDTILLSMRGPNGGGKLLLTASPNHPLCCGGAGVISTEKRGNHARKT